MTCGEEGPHVTGRARLMLCAGRVFAPVPAPALTAAAETATRLVQDDRDGVVEDGLAEDERVEVAVSAETAEDGEDGDGVGCRDHRAKQGRVVKREPE